MDRLRSLPRRLAQRLPRWRSAPRRAAQAPAGGRTGAELAQAQLALDSHIDRKLEEVVADTELSAQAIVHHVRQLYDSAAAVMRYLDLSDQGSQQIGHDIHDSVRQLVEVRSFLETLPAKVERDQQAMQELTREITALNSQVEAVQSIAMQSHLLAINAAIEASRAGEAGRAFKVVAEEVRVLASNSHSAAQNIRTGLAQAREVVSTRLRASQDESAQQLATVASSRGAIGKLEDSFEDMTQYYKTRFTVLARHNEELTSGIADVLGQTQFQDVVRQLIERARATIDRRNVTVQQALALLPDSPAAAQHVQDMQALLDSFLAEEASHTHSARLDEAAQSDGPSIELF
ncbi:methyl-accepting chemotaxis protein [Pseudoduganella armeniaca]|uniref:Methyl-accepting transducer domain-containing protein n=1 Tax=Pseudoduganella armeniaca TaxID=2072590 RepID=A0A2R4CGQ3_9BURK|nr:methyl-accepting chemotaxis protein [Pseudoduganella armeniaca]AVR98638.1 hypothetical protein C9I28_25640 [Pseudoduganella armeniaca]